MNVQKWIEQFDQNDEFQDVIEKYGHLEIIHEYTLNDDVYVPFPQKHRQYRNIAAWVLLADGSAIGWNESPRSGWSFPRLGRKTVSEML